MLRWLSSRCSRLPSPCPRPARLCAVWAVLWAAVVPRAGVMSAPATRSPAPAQGHRVVHRPVGRQPPYAVVLAERTPQPELGTVLTFDHLGERPDRSRAPCLERGQQLPFRRHRRAGGRIVQRGKGGQHLDVVGAALDAQGTLSWRGQHLDRIQGLGHLGEPVPTGTTLPLPAPPRPICPRPPSRSWCPRCRGSRCIPGPGRAPRAARPGVARRCRPGRRPGAHRGSGRPGRRARRAGPRGPGSRRWPGRRPARSADP